MTQPLSLTAATLLLCASPAFSQVNESREFPNVIHSPAAKSTPTWVRSVLQMEVVVKRGEAEPKVQYVNGTVVSKEGLVVSVLNQPGANENEAGGIQSASVLTLDGGGAPAEFVSYDPAYGVGLFRVKGLDVRPIALSKTPLVANRRLTWHTIYRDGRKTILYTRPLRTHKSKHAIGSTEDLCSVIDRGTSALSAERTGSALVALDGTLVGLMGWQKHWNVTPKNIVPRTKTAWAVPASVIARIIEAANEKS